MFSDSTRGVHLPEDTLNAIGSRDEDDSASWLHGGSTWGDDGLQADDDGGRVEGSGRGSNTIVGGDDTSRVEETKKTPSTSSRSQEFPVLRT